MRRIIIISLIGLRFFAFGQTYYKAEIVADSLVKSGADTIVLFHEYHIGSQMTLVKNKNSNHGKYRSVPDERLVFLYTFGHSRRLEQRESAKSSPKPDLKVGEIYSLALAIIGNPKDTILPFLAKRTDSTKVWIDVDHRREVKLIIVVGPTYYAVTINCFYLEEKSNDYFNINYKKNTETKIYQLLRFLDKSETSE